MKLSKRSIIYSALRDLGGLGLLFFFSGGGISLNSLSLLMAAVYSVLLVISFVVVIGWEYLVWKNYDYFLEANQVRITQGVLRRNEREIPLKRVQNVDVRRNLIHRIFDLARIDLETAGGGDTEASLKYVTPEKAGEIREHVRQGREEGEGGEEEQSEEPAYTISDRNLIIYSATSLDAATVFGIFGGLAFLLGGAGLAVEEIGMGASIVLSAVLLLGILGSFLFSFAKNFEKYFGFKLWKNSENLRYERGLLNRREGTIPLEKIQNLRIEESFLKRPLNFATLKIETAGYSGEKAVKRGSEAAIPLDARRNVVEFAENLQGFSMPEIDPIASKSRRRYFGRYMIVAGTALTAHLLFRQLLHFQVWWPYLAVPPIASLAAHLKYRNRGYATSEKNFFTVNGFWNRKTLTVPYYRIQNLMKSQTVFQKRLGLSSLTVDIAGAGGLSSNPVIHDLETGKTEEVEEEIYSCFRESLRDHSSM